MLNRMTTVFVDGLLLAVAVIVWPIFMFGQMMTGLINTVQAKPKKGEDGRDAAALTGLATLMAFLTLMFMLALDNLIVAQSRLWTSLGLSALVAFGALFPSRAVKS